ncbi:MAG: hypothetical protein Q8M01_10390 [Rubrivivax sp.]|nr:hypothetical protein [Rubrivivax sp.]
MSSARYVMFSVCSRQNSATRSWKALPYSVITSRTSLRGNWSWPARTGVCVVNTHSGRTTAAMSRVTTVWPRRSISSQPSSITSSAACPSFMWKRRSSV